MDFHALQQKLFEMDPTDPAEDLAKLRAQAEGTNAPATASDTIDYLNESAEVTQGSLELDKDYSINDFAALAGVNVNEKQKMGPAGQAKGKDPMPKAEPGRTKHPLKDKLVGEEDKDRRIAELEERVAKLETLISEGGMKRIATSQSNKTERTVSNNKIKPGLDTYKKKPKSEATNSIKNMLYAKLAEKK